MREYDKLRLFKTKEEVGQFFGHEPLLSCAKYDFRKIFLWASENAHLPSLQFLQDLDKTLFGSYVTNDFHYSSLNSPLEYAIQRNNMATLKFFYENYKALFEKRLKISTNANIVSMAVRFNCHNAFDFLYSNEKEYFIKSLTTFYNEQTPIHSSAISGYKELFHFIKDNFDADFYYKQLTLTNKQGQTPLHLAAQNNSIAVVRFIKESTDTDFFAQQLMVKDNNGQTPLHLAAENKHNLQAIMEIFLTSLPNKRLRQARLEPCSSLVKMAIFEYT